MNLEGFMYLEIDNPLVAWNVYRGCLISQSLVQRGQDCVPALSMTLAKMVMDQDRRRIEFERALEKVRAEEFPHCVSRLSCIFVFSDAESALAAATDEGWGGHISHNNLTDVGISAGPGSTRVDGNWISWMLSAHNLGEPAWFEGIRPYWRGQACPYFPAPIWELLVNGRITIWGVALRKQAYRVIQRTDPKSVALLEHSRIAASLGSDLGHISAFLTTQEGKQVMSFFIDMRDAHNDAYIDRLRTYQMGNPAQVNSSDLAVGDGAFRVPNFVHYSYVFRN